MLTACALVLVCSTHASLSTESQRIIVTLKMAPSTSGAPMDVAATQDAFVLHRLGYDDLAIYDASMSEWARDESLPIETD